MRMQDWPWSDSGENHSALSAWESSGSSVSRTLMAYAEAVCSTFDWSLVILAHGLLLCGDVQIGNPVDVPSRADSHEDRSSGRLTRESMLKAMSPVALLMTLGIRTPLSGIIQSDMVFRSRQWHLMNMKWHQHLFPTPFITTSWEWPFPPAKMSERLVHWLSSSRGEVGEEHQQVCGWTRASHFDNDYLHISICVSEC